jgi:DNA modification methylase
MHPTVKPISMVSDAILDVTRRRDIILDPLLRQRHHDPGR